MTQIMLAGLILGLYHALEPDHLAAVASLAAGERKARRIIWQGAWWGIGHAVTLSAVVGAAIYAGAIIPEQWSRYFEAAVGLMLVYLGVRLIREIWRRRLHIHMHTHDGLHRHAHFHAHEQLASATTLLPHHRALHEHTHMRRISIQALLVGMTHGLAGSAALIVLALAAMRDIWSGLAYVALFSLGSIAGMVALTAALSAPLIYAVERFSRWHQLAQVTIAGATMIIGGRLVLQLAV